MTQPEGLFYKDHARDMQDPEYRRGWVVVGHRLDTISRILTKLDDTRIERGLSKAAVGRMLDMPSSGVRRLFTHAGANPTLETLADLATVLGYRVTLEPLPPDEAAEVEAVLAHVRR